MGQVFGPGAQDIRAVMTHEMLQSLQGPMGGPQKGFGMPPSGEYGQQDNNQDGQPLPDGDQNTPAPGQQPGQVADGKQYTFSNPDGTTYQHALYHHPAQTQAEPEAPPDQSIAPSQQPAEQPTNNVEQMPGPQIDFGQVFGNKAGKAQPMIQPAVLPPTQAQQPSWIAETQDVQSPLLNTIGIWQ